MDELEIHRFEELGISGTVSEAGTRKGTESTISLVREFRLPVSSERLLNPIQIKNCSQVQCTSGVLQPSRLTYTHLQPFFL